MSKFEQGDAVSHVAGIASQPAGWRSAAGAVGPPLPAATRATFIGGHGTLDPMAELTLAQRSAPAPADARGLPDAPRHRTRLVVLP
jgi:hypothetical protein